MNSVIFICPYFGTFPKQSMQLWLQSCSANTDVNWLIFTDDNTPYLYPENVRVEYISFVAFWQYIQEKFDFPINLEKPYKLCDFKPLYGYLFSEYISEYDFWGHCDLADCIFGNIRKFITEELLVNYDKIGFLGHMTLYRNTKSVNERFMLKTGSGITIKDIFSSSENMAFDELTAYSINSIYKEYNFDMVRVDEAYVDISPLRYAFQASKFDENYTQYYDKKVPMIFFWNRGKLFELKIKKGQVSRREIAYVHFQKRQMNKTFEGGCDQFYIVPNQFVKNMNFHEMKLLRKYSVDRIYGTFFRLKYDALKYHLKMFKKKFKL